MSVNRLLFVGDGVKFDKFSFHSSEKGFSLIELMIAMVLGLFIIMGIGAVYLGAKSSFSSQNATSTIQENARFAFELMGSDIRLAGFTGGPVDKVVVQPAGWADQKDIANFPLRGFDDGGGTLPTLPVSRPRVRGDLLNVVRVDANDEMTLDGSVAPNPNGQVFTLATWPTSAPQIGMFMLASDYTHAAGYSVAAVNSGSKTITATSTDSVVGFGGVISARSVYPIRGATYYIANNPSGEPSLYRLKLDASGGTTAEELIEGVYDMQILYGVDYADSAASIVITNAAWTSGVATITTASAHGLVSNDYISITGVIPAGFNGYFKVTSSNANNFTVINAANPGGYVSGGAVQRAGDRSVDGYWSASSVESGSSGGSTIPGAANSANYWNHVVSVRIALTLTSKSTEKISSTNASLTKNYTTTFAVRNRL